jgi:hypothetical protein
MDLSSDSQILAATRKVGTEWYFPNLDFRAQMGQGRPLDQAISWCNAVRGEHERQESKRIAEGERKGALARAASEQDSYTIDTRAGAVSVAADIPTPQTQVQVGDAEGRIREQIAALETSVEAHSKVIESCSARMEASYAEVCKADILLAIFRKTLEEIIGATKQEVLYEVGEDIRPEVHTGGKRRSRGVGNKDNPEGASQAASAGGEGSDGAT